MDNHHEPIECGSEEGITIGLLDTICNCLHLLKGRDISSPAITDAIDDAKKAAWRAKFMQSPSTPTLHTGQIAKNWQPIQTAPKDGTEVLVLYWHKFNRVRLVGRYDDTSGRWLTPGNRSIKPMYWTPIPDDPDAHQ